MTPLARANVEQALRNHYGQVPPGVVDAIAAAIEMARDAEAPVPAPPARRVTVTKGVS